MLECLWINYSGISSASVNFKLARIVFEIISCGVVSLFIWDKYKELIWQKQLIYIGIGIVATGLLNAVGYCRE